MSKNEKLINKFLEKPVRTDITIDEVRTIAAIIGAELLAGGRHSVHFVHKPSGTVIPIPIHGKAIGAAYIRQIATVIENTRRRS